MLFIVAKHIICTTSCKLVHLIYSLISILLKSVATRFTIFIFNHLCSYIIHIHLYFLHFPSISFLLIFLFFQAIIPFKQEREKIKVLLLLCLLLQNCSVSKYMNDEDNEKRRVKKLKKK